MLSFHSALCPDSDIARPLPPMSLSEICRSKNIHPLIQTTAKKKKAVLGPGVAGFFPWAVSPVPENRESLRLMFNLTRTGNACNLSCQNVSHALQFSSKHLNVARCVYKQTYRSGFADRPISCSFLNLFPTPSPQEYQVFNAKCSPLKGWMFYLCTNHVLVILHLFVFSTYCRFEMPRLCSCIIFWVLGDAVLYELVSSYELLGTRPSKAFRLNMMQHLPSH